MSPTRIVVWGAIFASACGFDSHASGSARAQLRCSQTSDCPGSSRCLQQLCRCQLQSDCGGDFACANGACAHQSADDDAAAAMSCQVDRDCDPGMGCEQGSCEPHENDPKRPHRPAAVAGGGAIAGNAAAGNGGSAAPVAGCTSDLDCPLGLECEHGSCQLQGGWEQDAGADDDHRGGDDGDRESGDGGHVDAGIPGPSGRVCQRDADCSAEQRCEDGRCSKHGGPGRH
jgi:hypothetical protein